MRKVAVLLGLFICYTGYSIIVYTKGTENDQPFPDHERQLVIEGKQIFQKKNCTACHQVYGLGGYLGPDLTTAWSDSNRGEAYLSAILKAGGARMPAYHFSDRERNALLAYLRYIDLSTRKRLAMQK